MHEVLERLRRELSEGVRGLSASEGQVHPAAGKWNIQQVVEHLTLTYEATSAVVGVRLEKRSGTKARATLGQRMWQFAITRLRWFPSGRRAPEAVSPGETRTRALTGEAMEVLVGETLVRMDGLLARAETMFGSEQAISHLILGPMSVGQWRRFHLAHGEHHLKQILALRGLR